MKTPEELPGIACCAPPGPIPQSETRGHVGILTRGYWMPKARSPWKAASEQT